MNPVIQIHGFPGLLREGDTRQDQMPHSILEEADPHHTFQWPHFPAQTRHSPASVTADRNLAWTL